MADGAVRAAINDSAGGKVYHLTNDFDLTAAELVGYASQGLRCRIRAPHVPLGAARLVGTALAVTLAMAARRDLGRHVAGLLEMLTRNNPFTSERARRELHWSPAIRPVEGVPEAFRWWSEHRRR